MEELNLLILFGGQSSEHEISCLSAINVIRSVDRNRYHMILVGITHEGRWVLTDNLKQIEDGSWIMGNVNAVLSPDATKQCLYLMDPRGMKEVHIDVAFPVLHGLYGEDGTVQGLLELARIPYVGSGILSSAVCMDKLFTKTIASSLSIRQAAYVPVLKKELPSPEVAIRRVETKVGYPCFVKPSRSGSSKGIRRVANRTDLLEALAYASEFDSKMIVEEAVSGRELECAVFGAGDTVFASGVGEILGGFYDYDRKYNSEEVNTNTAPDLPDNVVQEIRNTATELFRALDCFSLARVDFFLDKKGVIFNEINTMPGFTAISMYPLLFEALGITEKQLVADLIETAFIREIANG
ncbi:MAG: D-alanine--D-alanine ligase [Lachnospiraceae bacterium]|nr:D-alanine--D-alanine ligase [Lachnospiraceae bacterium]